MKRTKNVLRKIKGISLDQLFNLKTNGFFPKKEILEKWRQKWQNLHQC